MVLLSQKATVAYLMVPLFVLWTSEQISYIIEMVDVEDEVEEYNNTCVRGFHAY